MTRVPQIRPSKFSKEPLHWLHPMVLNPHGQSNKWFKRRNKKKEAFGLFRDAFFLFTIISMEWKCISNLDINKFG